MKQILLEKTWKKKLKNVFNEDYMKLLDSFLKQEKKKNKIILPSENKFFNSLNLTKFDDVKVVIIGQDPYHGEGQANGLSFSVEKGITPPPSLKNIFKELEFDLGFKAPYHGNLERWAKQGVLLLNSILTVERGKPGSHANRGWEKFTDKILMELDASKEPKVFILWGKKAQNKLRLIESRKHLIIKSSHPSPYSANISFFGSKPFSKANKFLKDFSVKSINWNLNN